jgi:predicted DNA-binding transcriptional regulator AlpA
MKRTFAKFWQKPEKEETVENAVSSENLSPVDRAMSNLIKMKEATKLLRASAPTVRKYARMGHYREYRFGEKLVFYDKEEILSFILNRSINPQEL